VAGKRDQRQYAERPVPEDAVSRILDAGGIAGSANNCQSWRFLVLGDPRVVDRVAQTVHAPPYLLGAPAGDRNCGQRQGSSRLRRRAGGRAGGRAAQSMMLAAWSEGVVSGANGIANRDSLAELFGLEADEQV
jgi:nitroreductase